MGTMSTRVMALTGARHEELFPSYLDALVRKVADQAVGPLVVPARPGPPSEREKLHRFIEDELHENRLSLVMPEAVQAEMIYAMTVEEPAPELRRSVGFALADVRRARDLDSWAAFCADLASMLYLIDERAVPLKPASPAIVAERRTLLPSFFQRLGVPTGGMIPDTLRAAIAGALGLSEPPLPAWAKPGVYAFNPRLGVRGYNLKILSVSSSHVLLDGVVEQKPLPIGWFVASYKPSDRRVNIAGFPCGECCRPLDDWGECGMCADRLWGVVVEGGISTTHLWWCRKTWRAMGASGACTCDAHRNKVEFWDPSRSDRLERAWYEIKGRAAPMAPDLEQNLRTLARAMGDSFEDVVEAARQLGVKFRAKGDDYLQSLPRCGQPSEDHATTGCGRYVGHTGQCDQALDLTAPGAFLPVERGQIYSTSSGGRGVVDKRTGGDRWCMLWDKDDGSGTFDGLPTNVEEGARSGDWRLIGIQTPSGARVMVGEQRVDPGRTDDMQRGRIEVLAVLSKSKVRLRWPSGAWGTFEASTVAGWPLANEAAEERPSELHLLMPLAEALASVVDDSVAASRRRIDIALQLAATSKPPLHRAAFAAALRSLSEGMCGARRPSAWEVRYAMHALCVFARELDGLRAPAGWQVRRARCRALDASAAALSEDLPADFDDTSCCCALSRYLEGRTQPDRA